MWQPGNGSFGDIALPCNHQTHREHAGSTFRHPERLLKAKYGTTQLWPHCSFSEMGSGKRRIPQTLWAGLVRIMANPRGTGELAQLGKGPCHLAWPPELSPWNWRRGPAPASCPLMYTYDHTHVHTHIHIHMDLYSKILIAVDWIQILLYDGQAHYHWVSSASYIFFSWKLEHCTFSFSENKLSLIIVKILSHLKIFEK